MKKVVLILRVYNCLKSYAYDRSLSGNMETEGIQSAMRDPRTGKLLPLKKTVARLRCFITARKELAKTSFKAQVF